MLEQNNVTIPQYVDFAEFTKFMNQIEQQKIEEDYEVSVL